MSTKFEDNISFGSLALLAKLMRNVSFQKNCWV